MPISFGQIVSDMRRRRTLQGSFAIALPQTVKRSVIFLLPFGVSQVSNIARDCGRRGAKLNSDGREWCSCAVGFDVSAVLLRSGDPLLSGLCRD